MPEVYSNAQMPGYMVHEVCQLQPQGLTLWKTTMEKLQLSARAYDRILKVARTSADLAGSAETRIEDFGRDYSLSEFGPGGLGGIDGIYDM